MWSTLQNGFVGFALACVGYFRCCIAHTLCVLFACSFLFESVSPRSSECFALGGSVAVVPSAIDRVQCPRGSKPNGNACCFVFTCEFICVVFSGVRCLVGIIFVADPFARVCTSPAALEQYVAASFGVCLWSLDFAFFFAHLDSCLEARVRTFSNFMVF